MPLTASQQRCFDLLQQYINEHRRSPTIQEMRQLMGLKSVSPIQHYLYKLRDAGLITWKSKCTRTIQIVKPEVIPPAPPQAIPEDGFCLRATAPMLGCQVGDLLIFREADDFEQLQIGDAIALKAWGSKMVVFYAGKSHAGNIKIKLLDGTRHSLKKHETYLIGVFCGIWREPTPAHLEKSVAAIA